MYHAHVLEGKGRTPFPHETHTHQDTRTHTDKTDSFPLGENGFKCRGSNVKREKDGETVCVRLIPSQPCLSATTLIISHTHTYTGRIYSVTVSVPIFSR